SSRRCVNYPVRRTQLHRVLEYEPGVYHVFESDAHHLAASLQLGGALLDGLFQLNGCVSALSEQLIQLHGISAKYLDKPRDRLERTVGLQDGKEHLVHALIARWTVRELDSGETEGAAISNGVEQRLARWLAGQAFQRFDDQTADKIALQRDEPGLGFRVERSERCLIGRDYWKRFVAGKWHHLADNDTGALVAHFLGASIGADEGNSHANPVPPRRARQLAGLAAGLVRANRT